MQKIVIISAILACTTALPALLIEDHDIHYPYTAKSTITHSNQLVDHGSTFIHAPVIPIHEISSKKSTLTKSSQVVHHGGTTVLHAPVYHAYHPVMYSEVTPLKTTVTKSNQVVNHGGSSLVHASVLPVVHASVSSPVVHSPVYYSSPVVAVKSGDSATSHQSSTVHETVPVVNHYPLYAYHH